MYRLLIDATLKILPNLFSYSSIILLFPTFMFLSSSYIEEEWMIWTLINNLIFLYQLIQTDFQNYKIWQILLIYNILSRWSYTGAIFNQDLSWSKILAENYPAGRHILILACLALIYAHFSAESLNSEKFEKIAKSQTAVPTTISPSKSKILSGNSTRQILFLSLILHRLKYFYFHKIDKFIFANFEKFILILLTFCLIFDLIRNSQKLDQKFHIQEKRDPDLKSTWSQNQANSHGTACKIFKVSYFEYLVTLSLFLVKLENIIVIGLNLKLYDLIFNQNCLKISSNTKNGKTEEILKILLEVLDLEKMGKNSCRILQQDQLFP